MRYLATYLIYIAVIARAIGWSQDTAPIPMVIWVLLAIFGVNLFSEQTLTRRFPRYPRMYTFVQSAIAITMLYSAPTLDFLSMLFMPLSFQAVCFFPGRSGFIWIGVFGLAMMGMFLFGMEWQAGVTMVLAGGGANVLMGSFAHLIARTEGRQQENQNLFAGLQDAYHRLKDSTAQAEALAAAEERHRLMRELHDSLTQTLFSMNLAVQAAQLSTQEAPSTVDEHLARLQVLSRSAASEVQALTGQSPVRQPAQVKLDAALRHLARERLAQDGLRVTLEVNGQRELPELTQAALYRIAQEALNNITRHAGVRTALVRLCLDAPRACIEVEDEGCGFDPQSLQQHAGFGLTGMVERAGEIGWEMEIQSRPGQGTRIRVEERAS